MRAMICALLRMRLSRRHDVHRRAGSRLDVPLARLPHAHRAIRRIRSARAGVEEMARDFTGLGGSRRSSALHHGSKRGLLV